MMTALAERIEGKTARIAVIGQGYVGLPLAVEFARSGFRVTGIDADAARVASLLRGDSYIADVDDGHLREILDAGRFTATSDPAVLAEQDAIVICVPTPLRKSKEPDISYVLAAAGDVARHLRRGQLVVLESTTFPGTTQEVLLPMFEERGLTAGVDFHLAFSPERIDPNNATYGVKDIPKLVAGVTPACTAAAARLYRQIVGQVIELSSPIVGELAKLYENTFRSVNIALANEMAVMCRHLGVSTWEVIQAAASKPFGFMPFYPGPGIGGHCIPVDPLYLSWRVRDKGYEAKFIGLADEINRAMPHFVVSMLTDALNDRGRAVHDARLLVLGVAYKRGVADVRESPAIEVVEALVARRARVRYADPFVPTLALKGETLAASPLSADLLRWSDAVLILTDHAEFDYRLVVEHAPLVVDARNATAGLTSAAGRIVRL